jgi:hypothetical protein
MPCIQGLPHQLWCGQEAWWATAMSFVCIFLYVWVLLRYGSVSLSVCGTGTCVCTVVPAEKQMCPEMGVGVGCPVACVTLCLASVALLTGFFRFWVALCTRHASWPFCVIPPTTSPVFACACSCQLHAHKGVWAVPMPPVLTTALQDCWACFVWALAHELRPTMIIVIGRQHCAIRLCTNGRAVAKQGLPLCVL